MHAQLYTENPDAGSGRWCENEHAGLPVTLLLDEIGAIAATRTACAPWPYNELRRRHPGSHRRWHLAHHRWQEPALPQHTSPFVMVSLASSPPPPPSQGQTDRRQASPKPKPLAEFSYTTQTLWLAIEHAKRSSASLSAGPWSIDPLKEGADLTSSISVGASTLLGEADVPGGAEWICWRHALALGLGKHIVVLGGFARMW